jgi:uroporphyrinogen-III synthase
VLLTRPEGSGAALIERLAALGARASARPTIAFVPPSDAGPARRAVERLHGYDWIVFSSANGVRFFSELTTRAGRPVREVRARIAAIGPATARALAERGLQAEIIATESHSEGLASVLAGKVRAGERALLVRPEQARLVVPEALSGLGVEVDAVAFYRTVAAPGIEEVAEQLCGGAYDLVVFTSPSTLGQLVAATPSRAEILRALGETAIVAIGEVTAGAVRAAGLTVAAVARRPSDDGIVEAVLAVAAD